eukprot:gene13237-16186_t
MAEYHAGWADKMESRTIPVPSGHLVNLRPEPFCVVLAITPWNAFPALAAGNAVVVAGGAEEAEALIAADALQKHCVVGGPATGARVAALCAARTLPHGAQQAIFAGAEQSCVAGSRLPVEDSIADRFVAALVEATGRIRKGDSLDEATELGPLAHARQCGHVRAVVAEAAAEGAR